MLNKKTAFTLGEVLVTLAVLGVLASIMLPIIGSARPNKHKSLFKKAYYVAERMVYELVNDENLYPSVSGTNGFDSVGAIEYLGQTYGSEDDADKQKSKFCDIFARKVNTTSDAANCDSNHTTFTQNPSFKTTDGITWYMPNTNFSTTPQIIKIDVNGETEPNCTYDSSTCIDPDRFEIKVEVDGKMYVDGVKEKEYLESNNSLR